MANRSWLEVDHAASANSGRRGREKVHWLKNEAHAFAHGDNLAGI